MSKPLRVIVLATALVAMLAVGAGTASATSGAHFFSKKSKSSVDADTGALVVSWDEAGLGTGDVTYTLHADASATYACINGGGNHPKAANKQDFNGPLDSPGGTFTPEGGRVTGEASAGPLSSGSFDCPNGQTLVLACVAYTNITLTDETNGVTEEFADASKVLIPGIC